MTYLDSWEDFAKQAEKLYLADPLKTRFVIKYSQGKVVLKVTDDQMCVQYRSEHSQDLKKIEKLTTQLMRHMASRDVHASSSALRRR